MVLAFPARLSAVDESNRAAWFWVFLNAGINAAKYAIGVGRCIAVLMHQAKGELAIGHWPKRGSV
jgi:hypothetical protein